MTSLDTVIIFSTRMSELASFYQEALELGPFDESPGHIGMQVGSVLFGIDQVEEPRGSGGATPWFRVDDLDLTFQKCVELGATVRYEPKTMPWGTRLAALFDPDGNMFGLSERPSPDAQQ